MNVTINGGQWNEVFSGVDVLVPAQWSYAASTGSSFVSSGGTSLAAPQVAGAALLFKDWMIGLGFSGQAATPGVVFANMLAMTDRAYAATWYRSNGFDALWGAGRFQQRYYLQPDHPSGLWRWETAWYTISKYQHVQHRVGGAGNEPSGINLFKAYAVFFERDGADVADVDLYLYDQGCGSGKTLLNSDTSRDSKSMVKIGSSASGKDLCVDLYGYHVPPGETRQVVLVAYYTDETSMR